MTTATAEETTVLPPDDVDDVQADVDDPDAPYGRDPKGKPYKRPEEWRARLADSLAKARASRGPQKAPGRSRTAKPAGATKTAGKPSGVDYRPGIIGLLQIPQFGLVMAGKYVSPAYALDAVTLQLHGPSIADALHQTAIEQPAVAAILDRVLAVGPYGALLGALIPVAAQIAANHGMIQPNPEMGVLSPQGLIDALNAQ